MPASLNLFRVTCVLNGKVKDLDTNFSVRVFNHDSLVCEVPAHSIKVESCKSTEPYQRISSLVKLPVIPLDSLPDLTAEIQIGSEILRFDANDIWEYQDSLKFYDSFGLNIYKVATPRKFSKTKNSGGLGSFRGGIPLPAKEDFPFIIIGWQLEEYEMALQMRKQK